MNQLAVDVVFGTRPEAIKLAPIILCLAEDARFVTRVISTGQHEAILDWVLEAFGIQPDVNLAIHAPGNTLADICTRTMAGLDALWATRSAELVLVQGDTTAAMTAGLTAFNRQIPVVHVEAGLRTFDLAAPFPEEMNRRLLGQLATLNLAPTPLAVGNLQNEGVSRETITCTGNTVVDALEFMRDRLALGGIADQERELVLVTTHRRESWGKPLEGVVEGVVRVATERPETDFFVAMHPNPLVRSTWQSAAGDMPNIQLSDSVTYQRMVTLLQASKLVLTDSGGLQEEAPTFGKPVLVIRDNTERLEGIEAGTARLVGTAPDVVAAELTELLTNPIRYRAMSSARNPYGDGQAARRSVGAIAARFLGGPGIDEFAEPTPSQR